MQAIAFMLYLLLSILISRKVRCKIIEIGEEEANIF